MLCAGLLCLVAVPMFAGNPGNGSTECSNTTISNKIIQSNLHVPAGATCTLQWAEVGGNTSVDGTLISISSKFDGNVNVAGTVSFINNYQSPLIGKSLSITNSSGNSGIFGDTTVINGSVTVSGLHDGGSFSFSSNTTVVGGVSITGNSGWVDISSTHIDGTLNCSGNTPAPTSWSISHGYPASVTAAGGVTGGQCSDLVK
jgi:hypothetical protein